MSCLSWRPASGACVTVLSTRLPNGALRGRHRVATRRGQYAGTRRPQYAADRLLVTSARGASRGACFHAQWALSPSRCATSRFYLRFPVHAMRASPFAPLRNRMLHRPEKVIHATISDELEALLQVCREVLVIGKRFEMFLEPTGAFEREKLVRVMDHRGDLRPAAYDPLVLHEGVDIAIRHPCDALDVESSERFGDRGPLRVDDAPADPRLEHALAQVLEIVIERLGGVLRWRPFHPCSSPASLRVLRDPLQHDDRDDALGPLRVILEPREIVAVRFVESIALRSLRDRRRPDLELLATDLDCSLTMLHQVVIPTGVGRRAALRGRDHVAVAITVIDEGRRPDLSALRPARGEEQELVPEGPDPLAALGAELLDRALVPVAGHVTTLDRSAIPGFEAHC